MQSPVVGLTQPGLDGDGDEDPDARYQQPRGAAPWPPHQDRRDHLEEGQRQDEDGASAVHRPGAGRARQ